MLIAADAVGLLLLLGLLSPSAHLVIQEFGAPAFVLLVIGMIGVGGIVIGLLIRQLFRVDRIQTVSPVSTTPNSVGTAQIRNASVSKGFGGQLGSLDSYQFEKVVAALYRKQGYVVTRRREANPDGGMDLIIELKSERAAIQCNYGQRRQVGMRQVHDFLAGLADAGLTKGFLVALRGYTTAAGDLARKHGIEIIDEPKLTAMLESAHARFDPEFVTLLNDDGTLCPKC
jgi:hypothetical protein